MSFAVLPSISSDAAFQRMDAFKDTLAAGMRLVLFLTIPAALGLIALSTPIVSLVYQHHALTAADASHISTALNGYAIQIPFVGIDQMLIFSFYARKDTLTPMLVGVAGVLIYIISAWPLSSISWMSFSNSANIVCRYTVPRMSSICRLIRYARIIGSWFSSSR